jgi:hypothetical protein
MVADVVPMHEHFGNSIGAQSPLGVFDRAVESAAKEAGLKLGPNAGRDGSYMRPVFWPLDPKEQQFIMTSSSELEPFKQYIGWNALVEQLAMKRVEAAALRLPQDPEAA